MSGAPSRQAVAAAERQLSGAPSSGASQSIEALARRLGETSPFALAWLLTEKESPSDGRLAKILRKAEADLDPVDKLLWPAVIVSRRAQAEKDEGSGLSDSYPELTAAFYRKGKDPLTFLAHKISVTPPARLRLLNNSSTPPSDDEDVWRAVQFKAKFPKLGKAFEDRLNAQAGELHEEKADGRNMEFALGVMVALGALLAALAIYATLRFLGLSGWRSALMGRRGWGPPSPGGAQAPFLSPGR